RTRPSPSNGARGPRDSPEGEQRTSTPRSLPPCPPIIPTTATHTRVIAPNRWPVGELAEPPRPRLKRVIARLLIRRRVKVSAPNIAQDAKGDPLAHTSDGAQSGLRRSTESDTIGRRQRTAEAGNQKLGVNVIRTKCCHEAALRERVYRLVTCCFGLEERLRCPPMPAGAFCYPASDFKDASGPGGAFFCAFPRRRIGCSCDHCSINSLGISAHS